MSRHRRQALAGERGDVLIAGLLLSLALLLLVGLAVDIGNAFITRRHLAAIADQAALSASQELDTEALRNGQIALSPISARAAAIRSAGSEPDTDVSARASIDSVHVRVARPVPTILLRLVGLPELTVSATAIATPQTP